MDSFIIFPLEFFLCQFDYFLNQIHYFGGHDFRNLITSQFFRELSYIFFKMTFNVHIYNMVDFLFLHSGFLKKQKFFLDYVIKILIVLMLVLRVLLLLLLIAVP